MQKGTVYIVYFSAKEVALAVNRLNGEVLQALESDNIQLNVAK